MATPEGKKEVVYPHGFIVPSKQELSKPKSVVPKDSKNVGISSEDESKVGLSPCSITSYFVWTGAGWMFAYALVTGQCCDSPPIPSTPPTPGTMTSVECSLTGGESSCDCCEVCAGSLIRNGDPTCVDGNCVLANDYPTSGGPWARVFYPNGTYTWYNVGGL